MQQVAIRAIRLLFADRNRNFPLVGIRNEIRPALHIPLPPRSHHLDTRLKRIVGEFKANLVIAFSGRTMGNGIRAFLPRNFDLALRDQRPGDGGAEKIAVFVGCIGTQDRENVVAHEFFT